MTATGPSEAKQYQRESIPAEKIVEVRPAIGVPPAATTRGDLCRSLGIPQDARLILCVGPLVAGNGVQDAIWTFEILKYLFEDLHLLLIGGGPDRARLEWFVRAIGAEGRVHLLGYRADASALLSHGEMVWVPNHEVGRISNRSYHAGSNTALEAMAAGRPVVASRVPPLSEIVKDGETGFLIDPGDKVALARRTRWLLENREDCRRMGEAGKERSQRDFSVGQLVDRFARMYEGVLNTAYSPEALA
jgi:glycosyltransferase involved in cell wall biosynthesis